MELTGNSKLKINCPESDLALTALQRDSQRTEGVHIQGKGNSLIYLLDSRLDEFIHCELGST